MVLLAMFAIVMPIVILWLLVRWLMQLTRRMRAPDTQASGAVPNPCPRHTDREPGHSWRRAREKLPSGALHGGRARRVQAR